MKPLDDQGRFNPRCVRHENEWVYMDNGTGEDIGFKIASPCRPELAAGLIRGSLKQHLESALGRTLENAPAEPEPWRYFKAGSACIWRSNSTGCFHYENGGWRDSGVCNTPRRMLELGHEEITAEDAAFRIGSAVLGLPVDTPADSQDTGMWWHTVFGNKYLHRNHGAARQCWDEQARRWVKCHSDKCAKEKVTPATRESIIERLGEGPLK